MKHSIFSQTSFADITELERSYSVSVYCKVELNDAFFEKMNTARSIQCQDAVKSQTVRIDTVIPKSKVRDEYDLLAAAECSALTYFISMEGCNALGMIDVTPKNSDFKLMVSQPLTADLLASDPNYKQKLVNQGDVLAVKVCDYAATYFYTAQVEAIDTPWHFHSHPAEVVTANYYDVSSLNQIVHGGQTYIIDSRTIHEFLNMPLHRYQRDHGMNDFCRPLESIKKLLRKASPVENPEICKATKSLRSKFGEDCYALFTRACGPTYIQVEPQLVAGRWRGKILGFRRLYSAEKWQQLVSEGYAS